ncbi:hypothetical protein FBUS_04902 [Fasciolopsis buskii]|uniref:Uncharacterized protein n=1 Tax=Fasciolopsis buskii TaxID=27845 RepID=A0A8E0RLQ9_9TREM|nr:hypothetical protein FBUS_04902 [Fasciolopsis buski]
MKFLLLVGVLCYAVKNSEAATRAYENLLGARSIMRKCGAAGDVCISSINCCPEFACSEDLVCELRATNPTITGAMGTKCITDVDCQIGLCCQGSLYQRTCTTDCARISEAETVPAGTYYGRQFWNQWTRKRRLDHHNWK